MSVSYEVVLSLRSEGDLGSKLGDVETRAGRAQGGVERLGESVSRMGERMSGALESAVEKIGTLAEHFGKAALVAGIGAATYGVMHLNAGLEQTQISLAAIFTGQGLSGDFATGMTLAADQVAKMATDVKQLPGDMGQLSNIMRRIAAPAASGGANADEIRKLAGKSMLFGMGIHGMDEGMVAREMAMTLQGRVGSHNVLSQLLGFTGAEATKFKGMDESHRLKTVDAALDKQLGGSAEAFGKSWKSMFTTVVDDFKYGFLAPLTKPLFEHIKADLGRVHEYLEQNKTKVEQFTFAVGEKLAGAWDKVISGAKYLEPIFAKIAGHIESFNSADLSKMLHRGALGAVGLKLLPSVVGGLASGAGGLSSVAGMAGMGGPAGMVAMAAAMGLAAGGVAVLADKTNVLHDAAMHDYDMISEHGERALKNLASFASDGLGPLTIASSVALSFAHDLTYGLDALTTGLKNSSLGIDLSLSRNIDWSRTAEGVKDVLIAGVSGASPVVGGILGYLASHHDDAPAAPHFARQVEFTNAGGGLHDLTQQSGLLGLNPHVTSTVNMTVQIVVKGNDDPSRVARLTVDHLEKLKRNPTSSPFVTNYSKA